MLLLKPRKKPNKTKQETGNSPEFRNDPFTLSIDSLGGKVWLTISRALRSSLYHWPSHTTLLLLVLLLPRPMGDQQAHSSVRSAKRCVSQKSSEPPAKKRAPYAPKACDACRRRKGRCDGRRPCEYCSSRSSECSYSDVVDERVLLAANYDDAQALDKTVWTQELVVTFHDREFSHV
jgi:hypothetical protein